MRIVVNKPYAIEVVDIHPRDAFYDGWRQGYYRIKGVKFKKYKLKPTPTSCLADFDTWQQSGWLCGDVGDLFFAACKVKYVEITDD